MKKMKFADAIESALAQAMVEDDRIIIFGEDVQLLRVNLYSRFGKERVRNTPISESAFLGAAVTAAMAGLRPVAEVMMVDFLGVAMDALLNHASKIEFFSGGNWNVPLVIRCGCGGGYGDGGQHEQSLWGWLAHIPGLKVAVPSTPADAGALMISALRDEGPVIYLEHKLIAEYWRDYLGSGGRKNVSFDVPPAGEYGPVPRRWEPVPLGKLNIVKKGSDLTLVSVGVGVHRCLEASDRLHENGISAEVIDLRSVSPLDREGIVASAGRTGAVIVVDEDYREFGLSGEIGASLLEGGIPCRFGRVCTENTIPFNREREDETLPGTERIIDTALTLLSGGKASG